MSAGRWKVGRLRSATSVHQPDGCQATSAGAQIYRINQVRLEY